MTTHTALFNFRHRVVNFKEASGRLPTEEEGLNALMYKPGDWPKEVPWTPRLRRLPRDGWGNAYVYVVYTNLPDGFGIYSRGKDGSTSSNGNDSDDLNTWNSAQPWLAYYAGQFRKAERRRVARLLLVALLVAGGIATLAWTKGKTRHRDG